MHKLKNILITFMLLCTIIIYPMLSPAVAGTEADVEAASAVKVNPNPAPGVKYYTFERKNAEGNPLKGFVIELNPNQPLLELRPVLGKDKLTGFETLSSMAQRHGAVAAINGGFFAGDGYPIGHLVIDGETKVLFDENVYRTSLAIMENGRVVIDNIQPVLAVHLPGVEERLLVDCLNRWPVADGIGLYKEDWGRPTSPATTGLVTEIAVNKNNVVETVVQGVGGLPIPEGGYVVSFWGEKAHLASHVAVGDKVWVGQYFGEGMGGLKHLLSGGPLLVKDGKPVDNAAKEGFTGNILNNAPRTAVGVKSNGNIILVVIDGRQPGYSAGVKFAELSEIMIDLGAVTAVNLDGGGSTEMIVDGKIVNKPSDGKERGLSNALLVLYQVPVYINNERLWFDVPPVLDGGRTLVPMRKIFETYGAEVDYNNGVINAKKGETEIVLTIGEPQAIINGKTVTLDVPAKVVKDRTMVPLRFVSEALGAKVNWQPTTKSVYISW